MIIDAHFNAEEDPQMVFREGREKGDTMVS